MGVDACIYLKTRNGDEPTLCDSLPQGCSMVDAKEWAPDGELRLTEDVVRTDVRTSRRNGGVEETQGSPRPRINATEGAKGEGRDIVEPAPIKLGSLPEAPKSS